MLGVFHVCLSPLWGPRAKGVPLSKFAPLIVAVAITVGLAGCSVAPNHEAEDGGSNPSVTEKASTPKPTAAASSMTPLNLTVSDPEMGDSILVTGIVRHFPKPASIVADGEVILVQVTATAGSKFYAGWDESGAVLLNGAGTKYSEVDLDSLTPPMTAAGYTPFSVANTNGRVDTGKTGTPGWLIFIVDDAKGPLSFGTHHPAATTSGGGSIAEGTYTVKVSD